MDASLDPTKAEEESFEASSGRHASETAEASAVLELESSHPVEIRGEPSREKRSREGQGPLWVEERDRKRCREFYEAELEDSEAGKVADAFTSAVGNLGPCAMFALTGLLARYCTPHGSTAVPVLARLNHDKLRALAPLMPPANSTTAFSLEKSRLPLGSSDVKQEQEVKKEEKPAPLSPPAGGSVDITGFLSGQASPPPGDASPVTPVITSKEGPQPWLARGSTFAESAKAEYRPVSETPYPIPQGWRIAKPSHQADEPALVDLITQEDEENRAPLQLADRPRLIKLNANHFIILSFDAPDFKRAVSLETWEATPFRKQDVIPVLIALQNSWPFADLATVKNYVTITTPDEPRKGSGCDKNLLELSGMGQRHAPDAKSGSQVFVSRRLRLCLSASKVFQGELKGENIFIQWTKLGAVRLQANGEQYVY